MTAEWIVKYLADNKMKISTVESCTGGMVASEIVNIPGASQVFSEGYITYSEQAKSKIVGVKPETIKRFNVVSTEVAEEMAMGGALESKADAVISVTGIAGPEGGTDEIPVGTVCIGAYFKGECITQRYNFKGDRLSIRRSATEESFELLKKLILLYMEA